MKLFETWRKQSLVPTLGQKVKINGGSDPPFPNLVQECNLVQQWLGLQGHAIDTKVWTILILLGFFCCCCLVLFVLCFALCYCFSCFNFVFESQAQKSTDTSHPSSLLRAHWVWPGILPWLFISQGACESLRDWQLDQYQENVPARLLNTCLLHCLLPVSAGFMWHSGLTLAYFRKIGFISECVRSRRFTQYVNSAYANYWLFANKVNFASLLISC